MRIIDYFQVPYRVVAGNTIVDRVFVPKGWNAKDRREFARKKYGKGFRLVLMSGRQVGCKSVLKFWF